MNQTTLVTIAYELDFRMLILQAISIYRNFNHLDIHEYIIINNGNNTENKILEKYFKRIFSDTFFEKIKVIHSKDILSNDEYSNCSGQRSQQILKLRASKFVNTTNYIILDAKNFFIRKSNIRLFVGNEKYLTTFSTNISEYWTPYINNSFLELNVETNNFDIYKDRKMPTITPYVMDTKSVRSLVSILETSYNGNIAKIFEKYHGKVTEFFLYFAYLKKTNQVDRLYENSKSICTTFFAQSPSEYSLIDKNMKDIAGNENIHLIGLHKSRLPQLSQEHLYLLQNVLSKSLLYPWEDLKWFLDWNNQHII
ncbi:hypothetical protein A1D29_00310 [Pasteurellaceae bacterium Orientalotternb1]|nr:hypothetical protein A1D29_00310 [Pasteurellaceae bacterium Orientalotternb1]